MNKAKQLKELQEIPGIGKAISNYLWEIEIKSVKNLKGKNPEELYLKSCARQGEMIDRCLLYVYREAVYFAENEVHDQEKLKWWNWKD